MQRDSTSGVYAMVNQQVTRNAAGGGLTLFGNLVQADAHRHTDQMFIRDMLRAPPFSSRPVSDRLADAARIAHANGLGSPPVRGSEFVTELNYSAQIVPGLALMPSVQYIHHPGGNARNGNATVLGLRVTATF